MQPNTPDNKSTTGEGKLSQAAGSAHTTVENAVSRANGAVDEVAGAVKPIIGRVAESAHQAVDKAVNLAGAPAEWLNKKSEDLKETQERVLTEARDYVIANPLKAVGIALAAGLFIGRIMR